MSDFIFGGNGFIGRHLYDYLKQNGANPVSFDVGLRENNLKVLPHSFKNVDVRLALNNGFFDSFENTKTIYNLAAIHTTPGHEHNEYFATNINGAANICQLASDIKIKKIIFTSSISVYGPGEDLKSEETLTMPSSAYGSSKLAAEWIHRAWLSSDNSRQLAVLRPGVVFGLGEGGNFTRLYKAMKSGIFVYPGRKDTLKACIYVKDLVRAMVEMENSKNSLELFNMSYENPPTIQEICETIAEVTKVKAPKFKIPARVLKGTAFLAHKAASALGKKNSAIHPDRITKLIVSTNISGKKLAESVYRPKYNLKEAIEDWYDDCNRQGLY